MTVVAVTPNNVSDATGLGQQGHLVYAVNSARWWLFWIDSAATTSLKSAYSSDLVTWTAGATLTLPQAHDNTGRNFSVAYKNISSNDVISMTIWVEVTATNHIAYHCRGTISGTTLSWGTAASYMTDTNNFSPGVVAIDNLIDSVGLHVNYVAIFGDMNVIASTNADSGSSWTGGFGGNATLEFSVSQFSSVACFNITSGNMLVIGDLGATSGTTYTTVNLHWWKYTGSWSAGVNVRGSDLGTAMSKADWTACARTTGDVHLVLRNGNQLEHYRHNATSWSSVVNLPAQVSKAGSGLHLATDGTDVYLFCIDSGSANAVMWIKWTVAGGWGSWQTLEGSTATRNYISGAKVFPSGSSKVPVIWTEGSANPYDIEVGYIDLTPATPQPPYRVGTDAVGGSTLRVLGGSSIVTTTPVSNDLQTTWHTRAALGDNQQTTWHTRAVVNDDSNQTWHVRTVVQDNLAEAWHARAAVGQNNQEAWHTRFALGDTQQTTWHVRTTILDDIAQAWAVRTSAGQQRSTDWRVRAAVGQNAQQAWGVGGHVPVDLATNWNVRTSAFDDLTQAWAVRSSAGQNAQQTWHSRAAAGQNSQQAWAVRTALADTVQTTWHARAAVSDDIVQSWMTRAAAGQSSSEAWAVRTRVNDDIVQAWAVRTSAGQQRATDWVVRALAGANSVQAWDQLEGGTVGKQLTSTWNVGGHVFDDLSTNWHTRRAVQKDAASTWHLRATVTKDTVEAWVQRALAGDSVASGWHTRAPAFDTLQTAWDTRAVARLDGPLAWHARDVATKDGVSSWRTFEVGGDEFASVWVVGALAGASATVRWRVSSSAVVFSTGRLVRDTRAALVVPQPPATISVRRTRARLRRDT